MGILRPLIDMEEPEVIPSETERMVYSVSSRKTKGKRYRVDLLGMSGAGECACKDFQTRRGPAIRRGEPVGTRATLCFHVLVARRHFLNQLLATMAKNDDTPQRLARP